MRLMASKKLQLNLRRQWFKAWGDKKKEKKGGKTKPQHYQIL